MQILQLIGVLIIVNSLTCAGWFVAHDKTLGAGGIALVVFSIVAGLALIFNEKAVEISFGKIATLKAAAQQATTDAKEIAAVRQRVEAQAATLDLVAKESADAKRLLGSLREENKNADEKLKLLDQKTAEIYRLPDGRTRMGNMITGNPSVLQEQFDRMITFYKDKKFEDAYAAAKVGIKTFEDSKKAEQGVSMSAGSVNPEAVAVLYSVGAELAQRFSEHPKALEWAEKAVLTAPSPERKALLVTALFNEKKPEAAQKLVDETLAQKNEESDQFKALLQDIGVLKK